MIVRRASTADVEAIVRTFRAARAEATPWLPVLHTPEEDAAFFGGHVADADVRVAEVDGQVIAFAVIHEAVLGHLYVAPEAQRDGIGTALLEVTLRAQPAGFTLWTHQGNDRAPPLLREPRSPCGPVHGRLDERGAATRRAVRVAPARAPDGTPPTQTEGLANDD